MPCEIPELVVPLPTSKHSGEESPKRMARNYNHVIRFLESWFADLEAPEKGFTPTECWQVITAIRDCQVTNTLDPLKELPLPIRRGLSMATLGEQLLAVMDKAKSYRRRGQAVAGSKPKGPLPSEIEKMKERAAEQEAREEAKGKAEADLRAEMEKWGVKTPLALYHAQLQAAANGNEEMRKKFPTWEALCKTNRIAPNTKK